MKQPYPQNQTSTEASYYLGAAIAYRNMKERFLMGINARIAASYIKSFRKWKP